ncbi:MAG: hypothetical protein ACRD63_04385, partial [Pyrinomonadaceae bacterium]
QRVEYFAGWRQDVKFGLRQMCHRWPTTLLAVVMLGIGVGAVVAVFSIVHSVVLRPLPFPDPDQIVTVWSTRQGRDDVVTPRNFDSWRRDARSFNQLAALKRSKPHLEKALRVLRIKTGTRSIKYNDIGVLEDYLHFFTLSHI